VLTGRLTTRILAEPEQLAAALPSLDLDIVTLPHARFGATLTTLRFDHSLMHLGRVSPLLAFARPRPDTALVHLPLAGTGTLRLNGRRPLAGTLGLFGEGAEVTRANAEEGEGALLALPREWAEPLFWPVPTRTLFQPGAHSLLVPRPEALADVTRLLATVQATIAAQPDAFDGDEAWRSLRDTLLGALRGLLMGAVDADDGPLSRNPAARRRLVAAADAHIRARIAQPIYTSDLCAALRVSPSTLSEAFASVLGVSPHRYLKLRRLGLVRAALSAPGAPEPLVKSIALAHGFWHLGQFARDYRQLYGEAPSETLARARGGAPPAVTPAAAAARRAPSSSS
jgi:AraC family ethanolamine operon transcriptional activator